mmetsp:Transcript_41436/g.91010  ORF Transcript_41436/g.91010 Transcript_41436/m.91010 type:complete len:90 (+) Transcript_41436:1964-2233(+)
MHTLMHALRLQLICGGSIPALKKREDEACKTLHLQRKPAKFFSHVWHFVDDLPSCFDYGVENTIDSHYFIAQMIAKESMFALGKVDARK